MPFGKILLFAFLLMGFASPAQSLLKQKKEQIKSLKVAFITDELKLTTAEAEKFWPLYNAYDANQQELRQKKLKSYWDRMEGADIDKLSDKEANSLLAKMEDTEEEIYLNRKKFVADLKNVISATKIMRLKKAEEDFNRKLLRQYRDKFRK